MITNEYKIRKWDKQLNTHPENKEDQQYDLNDPNSAITCAVLFIYSMQPEVYADFNEACRNMYDYKELDKKKYDKNL